MSWARHARLIWSSHGYKRLLVSDDGGVKGKMDAQTKQINDRVLVWLLGTMEPIVREQVRNYDYCGRSVGCSTKSIYR
jgi:hypothetical protein